MFRIILQSTMTVNVSLSTHGEIIVKFIKTWAMLQHFAHFFENQLERFHLFWILNNEKHKIQNFKKILKIKIFFENLRNPKNLKNLKKFKKYEKRNIKRQVFFMESVRCWRNVVK